uniref:RING-type domain-containing protein n=1 Tax=Panagrolaimus sp. ES5 TaxID=591445 RepID=A0AC34F770_9BILA
MYRTENKYSKIRIIENFGGELFVILLAVEIDELQNYSRLPIIICPVADIRQITNVGIYIINEKHQTICIKWPLKLSDEGKHGDYADWLHSELMEISDIYKLHFQKRVKPPNLHIYVREFNLEDELDNDDVTLIQLIFEEQNIREEQFQRNPFRSQDQPASDVFIARFRLQEKNLHTVDTAMQNEHLNCGICFEELNSGQKYSIWPYRPASDVFIARFRLQERNLHTVDTAMKNEHLNCGICFEELNFGQKYSIWPCESQIPHMFHFECMLKLLRTNNQCPFCRQPAE